MILVQSKTASMSSCTGSCRERCFQSSACPKIIAYFLPALGKTYRLGLYLLSNRDSHVHCVHSQHYTSHSLSIRTWQDLLRMHVQLTSSTPPMNQWSRSLSYLERSHLASLVWTSLQNEPPIRTSLHLYLYHGPTSSPLFQNLQIEG